MMEKQNIDFCMQGISSRGAVLLLLMITVLLRSSDVCQKGPSFTPNFTYYPHCTAVVGEVGRFEFFADE